MPDRSPDRPRWESPTLEPRYEPMPGLLGTPLFIWRRAPTRARVMVVVLLLTGFAGGGVLLAGADDRRAERRLRAEQNRARLAAEIAADQRPRRGRVTARVRAQGRSEALAAALVRSVSADISRRAAQGRRVRTTCRRVEPVDGLGRPLRLPAADVYFTCFASYDIERSSAANLQLGYRVRARGDLETLGYSWCKLNPRPIHADQGEFITVPLSRSCVPPTS